MGLRTIVHRKGILHVETPLGIVNVHVGLSDMEGRRVEAVEIIPNHYAGEPTVTVRGRRVSHLVESLPVKKGR